MKIWKDNNRLPIKAWVNTIEQPCIEQANNLANLPFAFHHIALMPDCHSGYGMPIGGVLATKDVIVPNAVGVDIGCGMIAVKTTATEISEEQIKEVLNRVREVIPVGFNKHEESQRYVNEQTSDLMEEIEFIPIAMENYNNAVLSLGTLGGGNHFIEIQKGDDGHIWLMIHSGSRNLGKQVCDYYNKLAVSLNKRWYSTVTQDCDLAFLPIDSHEGQQYKTEMEFCLRFAQVNRDLMMERFINAFCDITNHTTINKPINIHHNYASLENHFGKNVWVHRKGAIRMRKGDIGIIPGSMGTPSYIVEGIGNPESFYSASHGAGRVMSRRKANETITEEMAQESMKGIVYGRFNGKYDECPQAYKDIDEVIANESDLVKPLVKLQPLGVVKG
jgi:tRNA-splicing ligase RtcB